MSEVVTTISLLPVNAIEVNDRLRDISEAKVLALVEVMEMFGCVVPILVRKKGGRFHLLDGAHRLEAAKRLGMDQLPASVQVTTEVDARMLEASLNLAAGMTALDDAVFLAAWDVAYGEKYPETRRGLAGALARHGQQETKKSFAAVVAQQRGVTPRQIQRTIAAARNLTRDEQKSLRAAPAPVSLQDISDIGKITDDAERAQVVLKLSTGQAKKVSQARALFAAEQGETAAPKDPVEEGFKALLNAWSRAPAAARRRFVDEERAALLALLEGGAE